MVTTSLQLQETRKRIEILLYCTSSHQKIPRNKREVISSRKSEPTGQIRRRSSSIARKRSACAQEMNPNRDWDWR